MKLHTPITTGVMLDDFWPSILSQLQSHAYPSAQVHTSMPHTSMAIPHTSMPQTSLLSVAHQAQPLYGVADYSELHKDAPMTSLGVDELEDLLHRLKLLDYLEAFRENGCDQVADVALMRESDLREMGMKLGHIRRLLQQR